MSAKRKRLLAVSVLLGWCCFLVLVRVGQTHSYGATFLLWNLFLASAPLLPGAVIQRTQHRCVRWLAFAAWVLLLPNAPYILTDIMHMTYPESTLAWFDVGLLLFSAGVGVAICYITVADVQEVIEQRRGAITGWLSAGTILLLCGYGVYIGRFLRFNSWDVLTAWKQLTRGLALLYLQPDDLPDPLILSLQFGISLAVGYWAVRMLTPDLKTDGCQLQEGKMNSAPLV